MKITVRKTTETDIAKLKNNPTWGCGVSEFDWHYDSKHRQEGRTPEGRFFA